MLPMFFDAPDTPTLNLLFVMFTLHVLYIHYSLSYAIRTAKSAAKEKKDVYGLHKYRDSPPQPNLINSTSICLREC